MHSKNIIFFFASDPLVFIELLCFYDKISCSDVQYVTLVLLLKLVVLLFQLNEVEKKFPEIVSENKALRMKLQDFEDQNELYISQVK